jgi:hypothetical protein
MSISSKWLFLPGLFPLIVMKHEHREIKKYDESVKGTQLERLHSVRPNYRQQFKLRESLEAFLIDKFLSLIWGGERRGKG